MGVRARRVSGLQGPGMASRHVLTAIAVEVDSAYTARTAAYWMFPADTTTAARLVSACRYDGGLRCEDGRWRLASRTIIRNC